MAARRSLRELELTEDAIEIVGLGEGTVRVDAGVLLDGHGREGTQGISVVRPEGFEERLEELGWVAREMPIVLVVGALIPRAVEARGDGQRCGSLPLHREIDVEQRLEDRLIFHVLHERSAERVSELIPIREVDVREGLSSVDRFDHGDRDRRGTQTMHEAEERHGEGGVVRSPRLACGAHRLTIMLASIQRTLVRIANRCSRVKTFQPTRAPRARLARLGVILDSRDQVARLGEVARMCDDAGIDALWVPERVPDTDDVASPQGDALDAVAANTTRLRVGLMMSSDPRTDGDAAATLRRASVVTRRLEIAVPADVADGRIRDLLPEGVRLSVATPHLAAMDIAARVGDDAVLSATSVADLETTTAQLRACCERAERDPDTLGIALEVPVSIGRTRAEAEARSHGEALFDVVGSPADVGVFGTLEECQERVIAFAHAGVTDLRCYLPSNPDIHDVIAQLTAVTIGTIEVLTPGAPRSRDPDPPQMWGGRRMGS